MVRIAQLCTVIGVALLGACSLSHTQTLPNGKTVTCQPIYGNWCGKGYPADDYMDSARPVDVWDRACRTHDRCYDRAKGADSAIDKCDRELVQELSGIARRGVPVPRQMSNAYNFFHDNLPYRQVWVSVSDLFDARNLDCRGTEGRAAEFCQCPGFWYQTDGNPCVCGHQPVFNGFYWTSVPIKGRTRSTARY